MPRTHSQNRSPNEAITASRLQDINLDLDDIFSSIDDTSVHIERD
ncbi:hypothetical protein FACS1894176_11210 [Bacteroidia bacterium]|nr:hypothetical protein FACS1894176_11210 [Bacteroidia bacterium]